MIIIDYMQLGHSDFTCPGLIDSSIVYPFLNLTLSLGFLLIYFQVTPLHIHQESDWFLAHLSRRLK